MVVLGSKWKNIHGVDTYASMAKVDTLKFTIATGASLGWDMVKFDTKVALLRTDVDPKHKYYVRRPPGAKNEEVPYIPEPACYTYGHPLANESFSKKLEAKLVEVGGKQTLYNPDLYSISTELGKALISTLWRETHVRLPEGKSFRDL